MAHVSDVVEEYVNFLVGGLSYCMRLSDIQRYRSPDSYFYTVVKKEWHSKRVKPIVFDRDGEIFKYVVDYHFYEELPVTKSRLSVATLEAIQAEANFYNMPCLVRDCKEFVLNRIRNCTRRKARVDCQYVSKSKDDLVNVISAIWSPFCLAAYNKIYGVGRTLFQSSTLGELNIEELLAEAVQSSFGRGQESVIDTEVRRSFEITADKLNASAMEEFTSGLFFHELPNFAPRMELEVRPYKLAIYQEGGHFSEHRDSVRGENHIGTLVYILNSQFTGGELVVRQNETEVSISEPGEWLAMYGDCPHRIEPVTSGTRVSLIFDLYQVGVADVYKIFDADLADCCEEGYERDLDAAARLPIYRALDRELEKYTEVVICLTHLYPVCQALPSALKGSDDLVYTVLYDAAAYDLSVVPITVTKSLHPEYVGRSHMEGAVLDLEYSSAPQPGDQQVAGRTKLIIPTNVSSEEILSFSEYIHHVGNEPQSEQSEYLLTGLRVTKKISSGLTNVDKAKTLKRGSCELNQKCESVDKVARTA